MPSVKVCYRRIWLGIVPLPFLHTFLEVSLGGKVLRRGFYNKEGNGFTWKFLKSLFCFVPGRIEREQKSDRKVVLTKNPQRAKRVLYALQKVRWKEYHALKRNCFHWRNAVLKRAHVEPPRDFWWMGKHP